jgi:hypothetical protein
VERLRAEGRGGGNTAVDDLAPVIALLGAHDDFSEDEMPDQGRARRYDKLKLLPDEVVFLEKWRSTKYFLAQTVGYAFLTILLFIIPIALLGTSGIIGTMMFMAGCGLAFFPAALLVINWVNWLNTFFLITNKQIVRYERKIFRFQTIVERADVADVQSVSVVKPSFFATLLKFGSASITTSAQSKVIFFDFIDNPKEVETAIQQIRENQKKRSESQKRATYRQAVETYFKLDKELTEVKPPVVAKKPSRYQRFRAFLKRTLGASEQDGVITYHKHPVSLFKALAWPALILFLITLSLGFIQLLFPVLLTIPGIVGLYIILYFVNLGWFIWQFEDWRNDTFQVTDQYIFDIDRKPFGFGESRRQAELGNVQNVSTKREGLIRTIFNFGDVMVETAGAESNIVFEQVSDPTRVQNDIFAKRDKYRKAREAMQQSRQREEYTLVVDLFYQTMAQRGIPAHQPLPEVEEDGLAYDDYTEPVEELADEDTGENEEWFFG